MPSQLTVVDPYDCFTEEGDLPVDPELRAHAIRVAQCIQGAAREAPKVGRNASCPCGSGKKLERCCGAS